MIGRNLGEEEFNIAGKRTIKMTSKFLWASQSTPVRGEGNQVIAKVR